MLAARRSEPGESTHATPGPAPDEVVSGWSVNPRLCMPGPIRTCNERLIVAEPLNVSELRLSARSCYGLLLREGSTSLHSQRGKLVDGSDFPSVASTCFLRSLVFSRWARPLRKAAGVVFEMQVVEPWREQQCGRRVGMHLRRRAAGATGWDRPCAVRGAPCRAVCRELF